MPYKYYRSGHPGPSHLHCQNLRTFAPLPHNPEARAAHLAPALLQVQAAAAHVLLAPAQRARHRALLPLGRQRRLPRALQGTPMRITNRYPRQDVLHIKLCESLDSLRSASLSKPALEGGFLLLHLAAQRGFPARFTPNAQEAPAPDTGRKVVLS